MPTASEPTPERKITIRWSCKFCDVKTTRNVVDGNRINVPLCPNCMERGKRTRYCQRGLIEFDSHNQDGLPMAPMMTEPERIMSTDLWTHFTELLEALQVRMAGGGRGDHVCPLCEDRAHQGPRKCECPCHAARAYKAYTERRPKSEAA